MRGLEIADADVMRMAIHQDIARSDESRCNHRLHGLLLVSSGHSCQQVTELFGEATYGAALGNRALKPMDRSAYVT